MHRLHGISWCVSSFFFIFSTVLSIFYTVALSECNDDTALIFLRTLGKAAQRLPLVLMSLGCFGLFIGFTEFFLQAYGSAAAPGNQPDWRISYGFIICGTFCYGGLPLVTESARACNY